MKSKVIKVALTGGIASGKSLVSDLLEIHGCKIIDLDVISRDVVMPGTEGLEELVDTFGKSILLSDGSLDRKNLRDVLYKKGRNRALIEQSSNNPHISRAQVQEEMDVLEERKEIITKSFMKQKELKNNMIRK